MYSWQTFEDHDASLLNYGWHPVRVIDSTSSDLWFGCRYLGARGPCVDERALRQARRAGRPVAVWVARNRLPSFLASGLQRGMLQLAFKDSVVFMSRAGEAVAERSRSGLEIGAPVPR